MLIKTIGIIIKVINYNEKYLLVNILTRDYGRVTYLVLKQTGKKSKIKRTIFQPLSIIDIVAMHKNNRDIQQLREANTAYFHHSIASDIRKISIVFFLSDILSKILDTYHEDGKIFNFLSDSLAILELTENGIANFHITLLLKLSKLLGFYPNFESYAEDSHFDMVNGEFTKSIPPQKKFLDASTSKFLYMLNKINYKNMHLFKFTRCERQNILDGIIKYYRLHTFDFSELKSLETLSELY